MRRPFPGSSALRASTCGLKNDDPSGAAPLRDRQAVAAGEGSTTGSNRRPPFSPRPRQGSGVMVRNGEYLEGATP